MPPVRRAMVVGAFGLAMAACAVGGGLGPAPSSGAPASTTTPGVPPNAGPLVVGLGGFGSPRTLNPVLDGLDTPALDVVGAAVFASAYEVDPVTRRLVPEALVAIPSVANGGVTAREDGTLGVTYRVSPSARWSDGRPMTAADLRFTHEVLTDPNLPIRRDLRAIHAWVVPGSLEADGLTLSLALQNGGDPALLFAIILPAHQVAGTDLMEDWNDRMWAAGGPFEMAAWVPGQYLLLRRNPYYAGTEAPGVAGAAPVEEVAYRFFPQGDGAGLSAAFAAGLVQVAVLPPGTDLGPYASLAGRGARLETAPTLSWLALAFQMGPANPNPDSLNREPRFRAAVAAALDRGALAKTTGVEPLASIYTLGAPYLADGAWEGLGPDPARVKRLLEDLGTDLGRDLAVGTGPRLELAVSAADAAAVAAAEAVGSMLRAGGIAAEVQMEDAAVFHGDTLAAGEWDVAVLTFGAAPGLGRAAALARLFDPAAPVRLGGNPGRWGREAFGQAGTGAAVYARLAARLATVEGEDTAFLLLRQAERVLAREAILLPLAPAGRVAVAYWADAVQGVRVDPCAGIAGGLAEWRTGG